MKEKHVSDELFLKINWADSVSPRVGQSAVLTATCKLLDSFQRIDNVLSPVRYFQLASLV